MVYVADMPEAPRSHVRGALDTDFYQLTMMAGHWMAGRTAAATFDLFVRRLPETRNYLVAAGLDQALAFLEDLRFEPDEIAWLRARPELQHVPGPFFTDFLPAFRFTGDVWAMPEGTPVFGHEPILRVTAPIAEAQLVETALLATISFQTSIASRAARVVGAAAGRHVIEFGTRRAHGIEAGFYAARAACLAGCVGTSNVGAARAFDLTLSGTMAHAWVLAHGDEVEAFRAYHAIFRERSIFLLDTYDTLAATDAVITAGLRPHSVRLDSGDLPALARGVRERLDRAGWHDVRIFATGDLDEHQIAALIAGGAPIDGFGVGTALSTSSDAPALGAVYKLAEVERADTWVGVMKRSPGKHTWPGRKQVWRIVRDGVASGDVIGLADEPPPDGGRALLAPVMCGGRRLEPAPPIGAIRDHARAARALLPPAVLRIDGPAPYEARFSERLQQAVTAAR